MFKLGDHVTLNSLGDCGVIVATPDKDCPCYVVSIYPTEWQAYRTESELTLDTKHNFYKSKEQ